MWFLLKLIFAAWKREHVWSLVSLLAASLSYEVSSYPDLYDSFQCEKLCAKLLTLSLVTQCCVPSQFSGNLAQAPPRRFEGICHSWIVL